MMWQAWLAAQPAWPRPSGLAAAGCVSCERSRPAAAGGRLAAETPGEGAVWPAKRRRLLLRWPLWCCAVRRNAPGPQPGDAN